MNTELRQAFNEIGARLAEDRFGRRFAIDIIGRGENEAYQLQHPRGDSLTIEVLDVKPHLQHLVLDVRGWNLPISGRYLCGHDESHWFVAGLALDRRTMSVRGAMESLKPALVRREQRRRKVSRRQRIRRRTEAYVRQGEWFFLPRPDMQVAPSLVQRNGRLVRNGGKPHRVDQLYRGTSPNEVFVRGKVQHADHETITLDVWHRVVQNTEAPPRPVERRTSFFQQSVQHIAWLD